MYKNQIKYTFECNEDEDQEHIFMRCEPIIRKVTSKKLEYRDILNVANKQKETIEHFLKIETERIKAMEALLPVGEQARTHASLTSVDYAGDVIL